MRQRYLLSYDVITNGNEVNFSFREFLEVYEEIEFRFKTDSACIFALDKYEEAEKLSKRIRMLFKEYKNECDLPKNVYLRFVCTPCLDNLFIYFDQASRAESLSKDVEPLLRITGRFNNF